MTGAFSADEDQVQSVFRGLGECDCLHVLALRLRTLNIVTSLKCGIFNYILVNFPKLREVAACFSSFVVTFVNSVVPLVTFFRFFKVAADSAVKDEPWDLLRFIIHLLFGVQHVVALFAEAHSFKLTDNLNRIVRWDSSLPGGICNSWHKNREFILIFNKI